MTGDENKDNKAAAIFIIACLAVLAALLFYVFFGPALALSGWE